MMVGPLTAANKNVNVPVTGALQAGPARNPSQRCATKLAVPTRKVAATGDASRKVTQPVTNTPIMQFRDVMSPSRSRASSLGSTDSDTSSSTSSKENRTVQIVEKKGDVVIWGPPRTQRTESSRLPRIICYGDSTTAGYYNKGQQFQPYGQALAAELADMGVPCEVAVCGLCSFTTQDMLNERSSETVKTQIGPFGRGLKLMLENDGPVDLVIIMTGTNDMGMKTSNPDIVQHVAKFHAMCHEQGVPTVCMAPTQSSGRFVRNLRQNLADLLAAWAGTSKQVVDFIDVEDLIPRPVGKDGTAHNTAASVHWEPDDLHISAAGSVALGRRLAPHVASWLKTLGANGSCDQAASKVKLTGPPRSPESSTKSSPRMLGASGSCDQAASKVKLTGPPRSPEGSTKSSPRMNSIATQSRPVLPRTLKVATGEPVASPVTRSEKLAVPVEAVRKSSNVASPVARSEKLAVPVEAVRKSSNGPPEAKHVISARSCGVAAADMQSKLAPALHRRVSVASVALVR